MIRQCNVCGYWYDDGDDITTCPNCNANDNEEFNIYDLLEKINDYELVIQKLKVVDNGESAEIISRFGKQLKGNYTRQFVIACSTIENRHKAISNDIFMVVHIDTRKTHFMGSKEQCDDYIKNSKEKEKLFLRERYAK